MDRDKYLKRKYGISLDDYNQMLKSHDGGCWICGKPPKEGKNLAVDHDHRVVKAKTVITKTPYKQWATVIGGVFITLPKRRALLQAVREYYKAKSVRGLLCWQCNAALQKFRDDPERMESAAKYIRNYQERLNAK